MVLWNGEKISMQPVSERPGSLIVVFPTGEEIVVPLSSANEIRVKATKRGVRLTKPPNDDTLNMPMTGDG